MEIITPLDLSSEEESLVDMHSVLNVLNIVVLEILEIGNLLDSPSESDLLIEQVQVAANLLKDKEKAYRLVADINGYLTQLETALDDLESKNEPKVTDSVHKHRENLRNIFKVIRVRALEIQSRADSSDVWIEHSIPDLKARFEQFLQAVEKNSHGSYRIVHNLANKDDRDYLINFELTSELGDTLLMPIVFQDVMRDLLANARKYTSPGGRVSGGLHYGDRNLRYVVEDSGMGIPKDEISKVVTFGYRGKNVRDRPTRGGGFGLTKAYSITRKHNGRMGICSSPKGTRVEILIPIPNSSD